MRNNYDKTHSRIFEEVSNEESVDKNEVVKAYAEFWKAAAKAIKEPNDYSFVRIPNFGKFYISENKIYNKISYLISKYRKGELTRGQMVSLVRQNWQILEHMRKHQPRSGVKYKRRIMEKYGAKNWEEAKQFLDEQRK